MKGTILIVDDERNYLIVLEELMEEEGYQVFTADNAEKALEIALNNEVNVVVTDMKMPVVDGMMFLEKLHTLKPDLPIIMMTAYGSIEKAVEAMKKGAFDYICKPFENEELKVVVKKALDHFHLIQRNKEMSIELENRYKFQNIIGKSSQMQKIYYTIEKIAPSKSTVLITGESGTGKELIARAIHYNSPRKDNSFISVNCGALPESLLESELFGHEKGAFTGALQQRKGRFELAHEGTIFLDEVSEMPVHLQVKLLRVLQEMEFERVGGSHTLKVDVRVIAATNKDLKQEIEKGTFRIDLFYRLNVVNIHVPPLRERKEDIPLLANYFIEKHSKEILPRTSVLIDKEAMKCLLDYHWPGNVREMENVIERALLLSSKGVITLQDLPLELREAVIFDEKSKSQNHSTFNPYKTYESHRLSPRQEKALEFVRKHGFITSKYYAAINNISSRHALRDLEDMLSQGILLRIGQGRGAKYILSHPVK